MKKKSLLLTAVATLGLTAATMAQNVPSYVPSNGLVGWWPFNGNANDESGNGNNGMVNGATISSDRFGTMNCAYSFNGINSFLEINDNQILRLNNTNFTISFWTYLNSYGNGYAFIYKRSVGSQNGWAIGTDAGNQNTIGYIVSQSCDPRAYSNGTINLTGWHNVVVSYTLASQNIKIYFDGALNQTSNGVDCNYAPTNGIPSPNPNCNSNLFFGKDGINNPYFLNGKLDDIGIWNRALTECEIADLYNSQLGSLNSSSTQTQAACSNFSWNGNTYNQSGQYTYLTTNAIGCDSTAILNLTINQPSSSTQTETALDSYTWTVNNQTYTQSGTYTAVIPNAAGCDSTITLNLTLSFTGINEQENSKIKFSPNPASDYFMVSSSQEIIGEEYSIIDLNGKTLQEGTLTQKEQKIEIGNLSKGMYLFKIKNKTEQRFRILKN